MSEGFTLPNNPIEPPAPKKSNTTTIIIVVVLLVVLCCCIVVGGGGWWLWINGDRLLEEWGIVRLVSPLLALI